MMDNLILTGAVVATPTGIPWPWQPPHIAVGVLGSHLQKETVLTVKNHVFDHFFSLPATFMPWDQVLASGSFFMVTYLGGLVCLCAGHLQSILLSLSQSTTVECQGAQMTGLAIRANAILFQKKKAIGLPAEISALRMAPSWLLLKKRKR